MVRTGEACSSCASDCCHLIATDAGLVQVVSEENKSSKKVCRAVCGLHLCGRKAGLLCSATHTGLRPGAHFTVRVQLSDASAHRKYSARDSANVDSKVLSFACLSRKCLLRALQKLPGLLPSATKVSTKEQDVLCDTASPIMAAPRNRCRYALPRCHSPGQTQRPPANESSQGFPKTGSCNTAQRKKLCRPSRETSALFNYKKYTETSPGGPRSVCTGGAKKPPSPRAKLAPSDHITLRPSLGKAA